MMKEFVKYYFDRPLRDDGNGKMWWTLNYTWLFGSLLFIGLFLLGVYKYEAPIFYFLALIPFLMMIYNIVDEYQAFLYDTKGARKLSAFTVMIIFYGLVIVDLLTLIGILFVNKTN